MHRNYVFFVLANGSLKLPFIPAQKSLTVEGVLCTSLPVMQKPPLYRRRNGRQTGIASDAALLYPSSVRQDRMR